MAKVVYEVFDDFDDTLETLVKLKIVEWTYAKGHTEDAKQVIVVGRYGVNKANLRSAYERQ